MAIALSVNRNWEDVFCTSGCPTSVTEQAKCENAERAIRKPIYEQVGHGVGLAACVPVVPLAPVNETLIGTEEAVNG